MKTELQNGAPMDLGVILLCILIGIVLISALFWAVGGEPHTTEYVMDQELKDKIIELTAACDRDLSFVLTSEEPFQHDDSPKKIDKVQRLAEEVSVLIEAIPPR